jgi:membrane protease YdiL (CAAX protease family)
VIFQGCFFGGTADCWGPKMAAIGTSETFALLHFYSRQGFVAVFCCGLAFYWLHRRSGSLWPGIIAHAIFNFLITAETTTRLSRH